MFFSKSFGYAVRGVLYIMLMQDAKQYVQAEEIAETLQLPRHFVSKILKKLVKTGVLNSSKGKTGGFTVNDDTKGFLLLRLFEITDSMDTFDKCSLRLQNCDEANPCPMHQQMVRVKQELRQALSTTTVGDLLKDDKQDLIKSIATLTYLQKHIQQ